MEAQLDSNQAKAVAAEGHAMLSACPGSGKTRVLTYRAARLIEKKKRVVTVSFTRDASDGLVARIRQMVGSYHPTQLEAGTFHALALNQLRTQGKLHQQEILRSADWNLMIRQAVFAVQREEEFEFGDYPEDEARETIEHCGAFAIDPLKITPTNAGEAAAKEFARIKKQSGRFDFADMLLMAIQGMRDGSLTPYPHEYMLVDEFQDADSAQYQWMMCHKEAGTKITVVGDDDQAIYSWRNASGYAGMMKFLNETEAEHITLPTNYRCAADILKHSATLIQRNANRVDKRLRANKTEPGHIETVQDGSSHDALIYSIMEVRGRPENHDHSFAVIGRTNAVLKKICLEFLTSNIPYVQLGSSSITDDPEIGALINLLESIDEHMPSKAVHKMGNVLRWMNLPEDLVTDAERKGNQGISLLADVMANDHGDKLEHGWQKKAVRNLAANLTNWSKHARTKKSELLIMSAAHWLADTADAKALHRFENRKTKPQPGQRAPRPSKMIFAITNILVKAKGSLRQRITGLDRLGGEKDEDGEEKRQPIKVMTMHKSKGLEFDHVWVACSEDNLCPLRPQNNPVPLTPEVLEEERRLFYVAMTRAQQALYLHYRTGDGRQPSPFIAEAGIVATG